MIFLLQLFPLFIWTIIIVAYSESSVILFRDEHSQQKVMQERNVLINDIQNQSIQFPQELEREEREVDKLTRLRPYLDNDFSGTRVPRRQAAKGLAFETDDDLLLESEIR